MKQNMENIPFIQNILIEVILSEFNNWKTVQKGKKFSDKNVWQRQTRFQ